MYGRDRFDGFDFYHYLACYQKVHTEANIGKLGSAIDDWNSNFCGYLQTSGSKLVNETSSVA